MKRIFNILKKSKLGQLLYNIRDLYRFPNGNKIFKNIRNKDNIIILLGVPTFNNLGDHLIAYSSIEFIKDTYPDRTIVEIPTQFFLKNKERLKKELDSKVPIFIVGGGWMGNTWEDDEYRMQEMLKAFKNNKIVILPQTVYYDFNKNNANNILNDAINTYHECKDLTIFFREESSYEFGEKNFKNKNIKVYLAPDIALYCKLNPQKNKKKKISICLRKDREKMKKIDIGNIVKKYCKEKGYEYIKTDTITKYSIPIWKRKIKILNKLTEFSSSTIIITDRLHGMIFAALSNTKCIAFDNKTKKVSGVYKLWLNKNHNIIFLDNNISEEILYKKIEDLIINKRSNSLWKNQLNLEFNKMKQKIGGNYETKKDDNVSNPK